MQLPRYFSKRPPVATDPATLAAFERLYAAAVMPGTGREIDYTLAVPKWQFLCWLTDTRDILLHGSGNGGIVEFEPRQSNDIEEFGNRSAVYAASDGIWPMFFAVMDRDRYVRSLTNACFRVVEAGGTLSEPYYFFSINGDALPHQPWRHGTIYLLPRGTFEQQPVQSSRGGQVEIAQWASLVPVRPLARLAVAPADFPFLSQIYAHDPALVRERAAREPDGFPWMDE
ncbi:MAG: hypothetical protein ACR2M0_06605 [Chloroflexia bacterium]